MKRHLLRAVGVAAVCLATACAPKAPPPLPAVLAHPELLYPTVPPGVGTADDAGRIERGWRLLQGGDANAAEREFADALRRRPAFFPAQVGRAYVSLTRGDFTRALSAFDAALASAPAYVPGLVGRGQTLLALQRDAAALQAFDAALAVDGSLVDVRRRADILRFRGLQELIESARAAAAAGRDDEAVSAYERAIGASPESAFLHRELGTVERRQGRTDAALARFRKAAELDASDAVSLVQIGEILEAAQDLAGAQAAYRRAADLAPSADLTARLAALAERERDAALPSEFRAIASAPQVSRGDLAALVGVRLADVLRAAPRRQVVATDTRAHWAATWIDQVATAGVMEPFPNHTFQPRAALTRADLAAAVTRLITLMTVSHPDLRRHLAARPPIADMVPAHLSYPAAAVAVASGVMTLNEGRFEAARTLSGPEVTDIVGRLRRLADAR
jgi:tetratricopeptide (TPR) repeat protein